MKAVLISIQPKWCELIASGKKTVEVRKTKPKIETPFKCYIYCTQGKGITDNFRIQNNDLGNIKVIGEFVCDRIQEITYTQIYNFGRYKDVCEAETRLDFYALDDYLKQKNGYSWHISNLVIYDKPKELSEFKPYNRTEDDCKFSNLGYAIPKCEDCHECYVKRPPQSWCYVEELR